MSIHTGSSLILTFSQSRNELNGKSRKIHFPIRYKFNTNYNSTKFYLEHKNKSCICSWILLMLLVIDFPISLF